MYTSTLYLFTHTHSFISHHRMATFGNVVYVAYDFMLLYMNIYDANVLDLKGSTDFDNHAVVGLEKTKLLKWPQFSPFLLSPTTQLLSYTLSLDYIQHFCTPVLWRVLASITLECSSPFNIGEDRTHSSKHRPNPPYLWILSHFPCSWLEPITACCVYTAWGNLQLFAFKYHFCHLLPMWFGLILSPQFLYL